MGNGRHLRNVTLVWTVLSVALIAVVVFVIGPGLPPGNGTDQSHGQVVDNTVLLAVATPIAVAVLVYAAYALWAFRERSPEAQVDGPAIHGNSSIQFWWLTITTTVVLFLAGYGTVRLLKDGSGGGQGPSPLVTPAAFKDHALQVQVIGQQWQFTYRYPSYGGFETSQIELPVDTPVEFHVTSLDVIHSFWAYELGVKADANPGSDNIAYVTTRGPLAFHVRCAELCGVWHGYMFNSGKVVPKAQFASWITQQQRQHAPATKNLPPYSNTYFPQPLRRGG